MRDRDTGFLSLGDVIEAVGLLTRVPVQLRGAVRGAAAAWAYPVAGLLVGCIGALMAWIAGGFPPALTAGMALAAMIFVTGALHEDGLADTVDGFWGGWSAERRLEIMKDSHIGTYGVLALLFSVGLRWAALTALASTGPLWGALLVLGAASRAPMVAVMFALPNARVGGLSSGTGRPDRVTTVLALGIAVAVALLVQGFAGLWIAAGLVVVGFGMIALAYRKIGGQTGDVLGATQQVSEIAILLCLLA